MQEPSKGQHLGRVLSVSDAIPPRSAEYAFYALVVYAIMAPTWGISVPLLGAGAMAFLAMWFLWRLRKRAAAVFTPLFVPAAVAVSFLLIQWLVHDQSLIGDSNRAFINWVILLIVVQGLFLRQGFLHRFAVAASLIGLLLLPYLIIGYGGGSAVQRAGLEHAVGFANPNQLAGWFGFCAIYWIVVASATKRHAVRVLSFFAATGCLFVVALTVSRGAFFGVAVATVIAFRHSLKRGFLPILLLTILGGGIFYSGLFDQAIGYYTERGTEDSGRLAVWPLVIQRILDAPLVGVGADEEMVSTFVPGLGHSITPHNSVLYIGLASGIVPLAFFVTYCMNAVVGAYRLSRRGLQDVPFQLPLVIYALIVAMLGATDFMYQWAVISLCNAIPRPPTQHITPVSLTRVTADEVKSRSTSHAARPLSARYVITMRGFKDAGHNR
jgi:hypothetical protein